MHNNLEQAGISNMLINDLFTNFARLSRKNIIIVSKNHSLNKFPIKLPLNRISAT